MDEIKTKVRILQESLWVAAALSVMIETGAFSALAEKAQSITDLCAITKLPLPVLKQVINLLAANEFLISCDDTLQLTPDIKVWFNKIDLPKLIAQFQTTWGLTQVFIQSAREKNLVPGWHFTDDLILQAQGTHSEYIVTECIPQNTYLRDLLTKPGAKFLDVGAGVAKISLKLCEIYHDLRIVALEPADKPFALAQKNIMHSLYQNRIELRKVLVEDFNDNNTFDAAWFPHMFFSDEACNAGLRNVWAALKSGGVILTTSVFEKNNTSSSVRQLINSLYGGLRSREYLTNFLVKTGFKDIKVFSHATGYQAITAIKY